MGTEAAEGAPKADGAAAGAAPNNGAGVAAAPNEKAAAGWGSLQMPPLRLVSVEKTHIDSYLIGVGLLSTEVPRTEPNQLPPATVRWSLPAVTGFDQIACCLPDVPSQ